METSGKQNRKTGESYKQKEDWEVTHGKQSRKGKTADSKVFV